MKQYTIKPLVWSPIDSRWKQFAADVVCGGLLFVSQTDNEKYIACLLTRGNKFEKHIGCYRDLEAAKAAAEKWYQEQIEQALTEVTE